MDNTFTAEEMDKMYSELWKFTTISWIHRLKNLPRYDININYIDYVQRALTEEESPDGDYVKFSDIEKLIKEYERTTKST